VPPVENASVDSVSAAYDAELWHELYVMTGGTAGALAGLLFVAVSINLDRIIGGQGLPRRAGETLVLMVSLLTLSVLVLTPQASGTLGFECLFVGLVIAVAVLARVRLHVAAPMPRYRRVVPAVILGAFAVPLLVGAVSLMIGAGGGLYWFVPAVVLGFAGAVLNAWVLLVEIMR